MLEPCTVGVLGGVLVGAIIGKGIPRDDTKELLRALGGGKLDKLVRLLQLLEEPEPGGTDDKPEG